MDKSIQYVKEQENRWREIQTKYFSLKDILIYIILASSIFSLGLMNWTEFTFDLSRLSWSYVAHSLTQIIAYGAIIGSFTSKQLDKRKINTKEYHKVKDYNYRVLEFYRPEKLKEYVNIVNLESKKLAYLDKYRDMLNKHEEEYDKKDDFFEFDKSWKSYVKAKEENPEAEAPNEYCYKKEYLLNKIKNADTDFETDNVTYERLSIEDLTSGIRSSEKHKIPRMSELYDAGFGVARSMSLMVAGSLLTAGLILNATDGGIDAWVKAFFTLFLALYSAFKGLMNGERVFEGTTMLKEMFRKHHLHSYSIYEAKHYKYIIGEKKEDGEAK